MAFKDDIEEFHEKFNLEYRDYPRALSDDEKNFRLVCLKEEIEEYASAENLEEEFDALIDLVYFALGTSYRHGFDFEAGWSRVHAANMAKRRATTDKESKRSYKCDVIKPKGWKPPDLTDIVYPKPNPALTSVSGGIYAKKRKNLTDSKIDTLIREGKTIEASEDRGE